MRKLNYTIILLAITFLFIGCADVAIMDKCATDNPYTFWGGLWHGIIAPFSFIGSLFMEDVAMYALNNNGSWYDFGFVLGAGILFGGSTSGEKSKTT